LKLWYEIELNVERRLLLLGLVNESFELEEMVLVQGLQLIQNQLTTFWRQGELSPLVLVCLEFLGTL
jgi:hypothetical protein